MRSCLPKGFVGPRGEGLLIANDDLREGCLHVGCLCQQSNVREVQSLRASADSDRILRLEASCTPKADAHGRLLVGANTGFVKVDADETASLACRLREKVVIQLPHHLCLRAINWGRCGPLGGRKLVLPETTPRRPKSIEKAAVVFFSYYYNC